MKTIKYLLFTAVLLFSGCADDGDVGPKGDKGDQGDTGEQGETGTANVIYSEWFALNTATNKFAKFVNVSSNKLVYEFDAPDITQEVVERGLVVAFFRLDGYTYTLPFLYIYNIHFELHAIAVSKLQISFYEEGFQANDNSTQIVEDEPLFRYIIIPGENPISTSRASSPVDYNDYEAVKAYYKIPD